MFVRIRSQQQLDTLGAASLLLSPCLSVFTIQATVKYYSVAKISKTQTTNGTTKNKQHLSSKSPFYSQLVSRTISFMEQTLEMLVKKRKLHDSEKLANKLMPLRLLKILSNSQKDSIHLSVKEVSASLVGRSSELLLLELLYAIRRSSFSMKQQALQMLRVSIRCKKPQTN